MTSDLRDLSPLPKEAYNRLGPALVGVQIFTFKLPGPVITKPMGLLQRHQCLKIILLSKTEGGQWALGLAIWAMIRRPLVGKKTRLTKNIGIIYDSCRKCWAEMQYVKINHRLRQGLQPNTALFTTEVGEERKQLGKGE